MAEYIDPVVHAARIWSRIDRRGPDDCWLWTGPPNGTGYGTLSFQKRKMSAHRWVYEQTHGPLDRHLEVDHLCRVRLCCNPRHLDAVTHAENNRRRHRDAPTPPIQICKRGHSFTPENTKIVTRTGQRLCIECSRLRNRAYKRGFHAIRNASDLAPVRRRAA